MAQFNKLPVQKVTTKSQLAAQTEPNQLSEKPKEAAEPEHQSGYKVDPVLNFLDQISEAEKKEAEQKEKADKEARDLEKRMYGGDEPAPEKKAPAVEEDIENPISALMAMKHPERIEAIKNQSFMDM